MIEYYEIALKGLHADKIDFLKRGHYHTYFAPIMYLMKYYTIWTSIYHTLERK